MRTASMSKKRSLVWLCGSIVCLIALLHFSASCPFAAVALDGSMGTKGSLIGPKYNILQSYGRLSGKNLFQSFSQFDLQVGDVATFMGNPGNSIQNVIARVTSGSPSSINGKVATQYLPYASLWFINPAGMVFGPNASLSVPGSFHVSTADYLRFSDGTLFYTGQAVVPSILSSAEPSAFGFTSSKPAGISFDAGQSGLGLLALQPASNFSVVGGDITIVNYSLFAPSGSIRIASVASPGEVAFNGTSGFTTTGFSNLGTVSVSGGHINTNGDPGGTVFIRSGQFYSDNGVVSANVEGAANSLGGIDIEISGAAKLTDFSYIATETVGSGRGGDVQFQAGSLSMDKDSSIFSSTAAGGAGGNILISVADSTGMSHFSTIETSSLSGGNAGNLTLNTGSLSMLGGSYIDSQSSGSGNSGNVFLSSRGAVALSGASTNISTSSGFSGDAGNLTLNTGSLSMSGGSQIDSWSSGSGNSGSIFLSSRGAVALSGVSIIQATASAGKTGEVSIQADSLRIDGASKITSDSYGSSDAGIISLQANSIEIGGGWVSSIAWGSGKGGDISMKSRTINLQDGLISSSTFGQGAGGAISMDADSITIQNSSFVSTNSNGSGAAGNVSMQAGSVQILNGSVINTLTLGSGRGGDVEITAGGSITISGVNPKNGLESGISSGTERIFGSMTGPGGDIKLTAGSLFLDMGIINASSVSLGYLPAGPAGNININLSGPVQMTGGQITTSANSSLGGNISVVASDIWLTHNSNIRSDVAKGQGNGGNMTFKLTDSLVLLDTSWISANADKGYGGNITIDALATFFSPQSSITATSNISGRNGRVTINAPFSDIGQSLFRPPGTFLGPDTLFPRSCTLYSERDLSTFKIDSSGFPPVPDWMLY